jgi:RHS repeat-associated protein
LDYAVNRYYATAVARFTTADPIADLLRTSRIGACSKVFHDKNFLGNPKNWNGYTYVTNDPVNETDPLGLDPFWRCMKTCLQDGGIRLYPLLNLCRPMPHWK